MNKMHLFKFTGDGKDVFISARTRLGAIEIYDRKVDRLHGIVNQQYGNIEFAFKSNVELGTIVRIQGDDGYAHAVADANEWAAHWPNQVIEFVQKWGEQ